MSDEYVKHEELTRILKVEDKLIDRMENSVDRLCGVVDRLEERDRKREADIIEIRGEAEAARAEARTATTEIEKIKSQILPIPNIVKYLILIAAVVATCIAPFVPAIMKTIYHKEVPHVEKHKANRQP